MLADRDGNRTRLVGEDSLSIPRSVSRCEERLIRGDHRLLPARATLDISPYSFSRMRCVEKTREKEKKAEKEMRICARADVCDLKDVGLTSESECVGRTRGRALLTNDNGEVIVSHR